MFVTGKEGVCKWLVSIHNHSVNRLVEANSVGIKSNASELSACWFILDYLLLYITATLNNNNRNVPNPAVNRHWQSLWLNFVILKIIIFWWKLELHLTFIKNVDFHVIWLSVNQQLFASWYMYQETSSEDVQSAQCCHLIDSCIYVYWCDGPSVLERYCCTPTDDWDWLIDWSLILKDKDFRQESYNLSLPKSTTHIHTYKVQWYKQNGKNRTKHFKQIHLFKLLYRYLYSRVIKVAQHKHKRMSHEHIYTHKESNFNNSNCKQGKNKTLKWYTVKS